MAKHNVFQENKSSVTPSNGVVLLFGEVLADIFPDRSILGGAPFNVARHLQAFGLSPVLITRVGDDQLGNELVGTMKSLGMATVGVQKDPVHPTGQVIVHIKEDGHQFEIPPDQAYDFIDADDAVKVAQAVQPELVYFGSLAQRQDVSHAALSEILRAVQSYRILDINLRQPWYTGERIKQSLGRAEHVKMNDDELNVITGLLGIPGNHDLDKANALVKQFELQQLLVTCGASGAWLLDADNNRLFQQGETTNLIDTVGAGDGFTAVFITGTLRGWPDAVSLSRANTFATALCGIRGAIPDDVQFYQTFLQAWGDD